MFALLLSLASPASACGGFMCDGATQPVLQAAERVVFGLDEEANQVEMHVQVTYDGPPMDFAWVVPVPANPELFLTSSALFTQIARQTLPTFDLNVVTEGSCKEARRNESSDSSASAGTFLDSASSGSGDTDYFDVDVVSEQALGPYDTVVLQAVGAEDLTGWLRANGYDVPAGIESLLAPYVQDEAHFVALKLRSGQDTGDLAPLALRWSADKASIPVQLTSIAATPDMRMEAYVLADARVVPESYLHVQINDAAIDWWQQGANYDDVITRAANEAGGHAFATDSYGPTAPLEGLLVRGAYDRDALLRSTSAPSWVATITTLLTVVPAELGAVIEDHLALPAGVSGLLYLSCPSCYDISEPPDVVALTDDAEIRVIEPALAAQDLLDRFEKVSRMTSSLDAVEMTVDPVFVVNRDMQGPVSRNHAADLVYECRRTRWPDEVLRRLELADGRVLYLPSEEWFRSSGMTEFEYLEAQGDIAAQVIEETGAEGEPSTLADYTDDLFALAEAHNDEVLRLMGCGCATTDGRAGAVGVLALASTMLIRRRRSAPGRG